MKSIPIVLCIVLLTLASSATAQAADAQWVHFNTNHVLVYSNDANGNHIPDFSYAGYEGGGVALPTNVTVQQTLSPSGGDDTANIQNAINTVEALSPNGQGIRGAVKLNSGTFLVSSTLNITTGGVVLEGSGTNQTILHCTGNSRLCISVAGSGSRSTVGSTVHITDNYVPLGATNFDVDNASGFSVGNSIVVNRAVTQVWINAVGMSNYWTPNGGISFERTVTAINGNQISIDIPLCNPIEMQYVTGAVYQYSFSGRISQVGLQDFQIFGDFDDYATNLGAGRAIQFDKCQNSWASDLLLNHFYNGFNLGNNAKWVTVQGCEYVHNTGTNAGPDAYASQGGLNLYLRCGSTPDCTSYHVGGTQAASPGPIVLLDINSLGTAYDCEAHQRWACGCLYDRTTVASTSGNTGIKFQNRGGAGSGQGYAAGYSVMWNCDSVGSINEVPKVPYHYNWAIGRGNSAATWTHYSDDGIFDMTNVTVNPTSLYLEQLKERLGGQAVENIGYQLFTISGAPASQNVAAGNNANFTINVGDPTLMSNVVALSVTGVPAGASANLSTNSVTGAGSATLTVTTPNSLPPGSYTLNLIGTSAGLSHTSAVTVVVGSFVIAAAPSSQSIFPGSNTTYTITATTNGNFTGEIDFGISGLPANAGAGFIPSSLTGNGSSTLSITTAGNTPVGSYTLTIFGTNATGTATTTATLNILATASNAGELVWTNGSGADTNWSTVLNWTNISAGGYGAPGASNSVVFTNYGAVAASALTSPGSGVVTPSLVDSFVNTSFLVSALTNYANAPSSSPLYQNIGLAPGATLTVSNGMQVGSFTIFDFGANNVTTLTISGSGATLQQGGSITVSEDSGSTGSHDAVLDMSGLDNLTMDGQQIRVGIEGGGAEKRASGVIYLAKTNSLTLLSAGYSDSAGTGSPNSGNPALYFGHNGSTFGNGSQIFLGISNGIFADYATIGRGETNALFAFNPAFLGSSPSVYIRGTNGDPNRVGVYVIGDGSAGAQANNAPSTNDFSGGQVDAMINYLCVGRGRSGSSTVGGSGVLTFNTGTINANTLVAGFIYPAGSNSPASGIVNVNGSASLLVQSNIVLAQNANVAGQSAVSQGSLNINGGAVSAANVVGNGGTSTLALNAGALSLPSGNIANISAMNIGVPGGVVPAVLTDASSVSVSNALTIATNGVLAGNTIITSPGLTVNGTISPGLNAVGWITNNGPATFGPGGRFVVAVEDAYGSPVEGWDFLGVTGALNIQASSTNPFTIDLSSLGGDVTNFTFNTNYDWVIATAAGISNFNAAAFTINNSQFQNDLAGGYFYVHTIGNSLVLSFSNNLPPAASTAEFYLTGNVTLIPLSVLAAHWSDPDDDPVVFNSVIGSTNGAAVGADNNFIYYTNMNSVADDVTYTVADVRTNPPAVYQPNDTVLTAIGNVILLPPPSVSAVRVAGTNIVLSSSNGIPGNNFSVLGSTNVASPLTNWLILQNGSFDTNGNLQVTNAIDPTVPQEFYRLQVQ